MIAQLNGGEDDTGNGYNSANRNTLTLNSIGSNNKIFRGNNANAHSPNYEDTHQPNMTGSTNKKYNQDSEKLVEFPTSGNSDQFRIDGANISPLIGNRTSYYTAMNQSTDDRTTMSVQIYLNVDFNQELLNLNNSSSKATSATTSSSDVNNEQSPVKQPQQTSHQSKSLELMKMEDEFPPTQMTIESMIETAVIVFNEKLETINSPFRINPKPSLWSLYLSKKNGKPKQDLPALDRDNLLSESGSIDMFSLHSNDPHKVWKATSRRWLEHKKKVDEGEEDDENDADQDDQDDYFSDSEEQYSNQSRISRLAKEQQSCCSQQTDKQGLIGKSDRKASSNKEAVRNQDLISSVQKVKKPTKEINSGCAGLCSFSKKK